MPAGYDYVALRNLYINYFTLAFNAGQIVPDAAVATYGYAIGLDVASIPITPPVPPSYPQIVSVTGTPTDGQLAAWSATLGTWTLVNTTGSGEMATAKNGTSTTQAISAAAGVGAVVSITGVAISVGDSGGRPVELNFSCFLTQTTVGDGSGFCTVQETTSGAVSLYSDVVRLPNSNSAPASTICLKGSGSIGVVTTTRTFKLVAFLWSIAASNPVCNIVNSPTQPSFLRAVRG